MPDCKNFEWDYVPAFRGIVGERTLSADALRLCGRNILRVLGVCFFTLALARGLTARSDNSNFY